MHKYCALRQGAIDQQLAHLLPQLLLVLVELKPQLAADKPLGKQLQLAAQQSGVIGRQFKSRQRHLLHAQQSVNGQRVQLCGLLHMAAVGLKMLQPGVAAQIGDGQKTLFQIAGQYFWHMQSLPFQQCGNADKRPAVFLFWWRIHQQQAVAVGLPAKIAAKAGIAAGRQQICCRQLRQTELAGDIGTLAGKPLV